MEKLKGGLYFITLIIRLQFLLPHAFLKNVYQKTAFSAT